MASVHTIPARSGHSLFAEATVTPDNGRNTFLLPFAVDNEDALWVDIDPAGPGMTASAYVALTADRRGFTADFATDGATACDVFIILWHSIVR